MPAYKRSCSIDGCKRFTRRHRGYTPYVLCDVHLNAWRDRWIQDIALKSTDFETCLVWPFSRNNRGYGHLRIDRHNMLASRYICMLFYGPPPTPNHQAAHSCGRGNKGCVNPLHLRWATPKENNDDKKLHGTHIGKRTKLGLSFIDDDAVRRIRRLKTEGASDNAIAKQFNILPVVVENILNGYWWGWVE